MQPYASFEAKSWRSLIPSGDLRGGFKCAIRLSGDEGIESEIGAA
jgi:hypothetical protein